MNQSNEMGKLALRNEYKKKREASQKSKRNQFKFKSLFDRYFRLDFFFANSSNSSFT